MNDIYSEPEQYGLQIVWDSGGGGGYDWDVVVVWGSTLTGAVWAGQDAGCSCNSPFESIHGLADINELPRIDPNRGHAAARATVLDLLQAGNAWDLTDADREAKATEAADAILTWAHDREHAHDEPVPVRRGL